MQRNPLVVSLRRKKKKMAPKTPLLPSSLRCAGEGNMEIWQRSLEEVGGIVEAGW
jgi:hypothetical protein